MVSPKPHPRALIAEDEPLLAQALQAELHAVWPELEIQAVVGDGASAVAQALALRPDVLFFDIRMPGLGGLDAAAELAERWDASAPGAAPFPCLVFVTAYDQYAVQAFEAQAVDYLLKPVQPPRLRQTVARLQARLDGRHAVAGPAGVHDPQQEMDRTMAQLRQLLATGNPAGTPALSVIPASVGNTVHMVPVDEIVLLEAADKYVRVLTPEREYLIRTPLRELLPQLDARHFWQVHRAAVVRVAAIDAVHRDESGKLWLQMRESAERISVSRLYAHLFKAM
jgi:DNA-binding LytR/AlgR family response regulator